MKLLFLILSLGSSEKCGGMVLSPLKGLKIVSKGTLFKNSSSSVCRVSLNLFLTIGNDFVTMLLKKAHNLSRFSDKNASCKLLPNVGGMISLAFLFSMCGFYALCTHSCKVSSSVGKLGNLLGCGEGTFQKHHKVLTLSSTLFGS